MLLSFRNFGQDLRFESPELAAKCTKDALSAGTLKIELEGPKIAIPGSDQLMPGRRERFSLGHAANLVVVNLCPSLGTSKADTSLYPYFRQLTGNRAKVFKDLLDAIVTKLKLTQAGIVVDRLELLASLIGPDDTLKLIKMIRHSPE